jgi:adenosyl cobinamide kinase/adenosyl cobinamide phosphate guanylyltransferase
MLNRREAILELYQKILRKKISFETILGCKDSGKSLFAEKLFKKLPGQKCYIGTLPTLLAYEQRILKHKKRRPQEWQLVEWIGDFNYDANSLKKISTKVDAILLEGFSFFLSRSLLDIEKIDTCTYKSIYWLIEIIPDHCKVIFVDTLAFNAKPYSFATIIWNIHCFLVHVSKRSFLVESGQITELDLISLQK